MKILKTLFLALLVMTNFSCSQENNKLNCYSSILKGTVLTKEYKLVMETAKRNLMNYSLLNVKHSMKDSSFIISSRLDSAIFFNNKKDKCLLLLLQQTAKDLKLDQVKIIQGTLKSGIWHFSYDRLPQVPEVTYTLNKKIKNSVNLTNSFTTLSNESRIFVLNAGTVDVKQCNIDQKYWFGN